jgi:hypothetical protein
MEFIANGYRHARRRRSCFCTAIVLVDAAISDIPVSGISRAGTALQSYGQRPARSEGPRQNPKDSNTSRTVPSSRISINRKRRPKLLLRPGPRRVRRASQRDQIYGSDPDRTPRMDIRVTSSVSRLFGASAITSSIPILPTSTRAPVQSSRHCAGRPSVSQSASRSPRLSAIFSGNKRSRSARTA